MSFQYLNKNFWIEGTDQNSNCALTKNEISHKLRLASHRGLNKNMLEKEMNETGRNAKIIIGPQSSDEEWVSNFFEFVVLQLYSTDCHPTDCHFCQNFGKCLNYSVLNFFIKLRMKYSVFSFFTLNREILCHSRPSRANNQNYGVLIWFIDMELLSYFIKIFNLSNVIHGYWSNTY